MADLDEQLLARQEEERRKRELEERRTRARQGARILKKAGKQALKGQLKKTAIKAGLRAVLPWLLPVIGVILGIFLIIGLIILTLTAICGTVTGGLAVGGASSVLTGSNFCEAFEGFQGVAQYVSGRADIVRQPPRIVDVSRWYGIIRQAAAANNLPFCFLQAVVQKESSGDPAAIGHDHTAPPPPIRRWQSASDGSKAAEPPGSAHDPFALSLAPRHNLDWNFSHGIGLMQITIFPYDADWIDVNTPAREMPPGSGLKYTVRELILDPAVSINAAAQYLAQLVRTFGGDYEQAAAAYNGSGPVAVRYGQDVVDRTNVCIASSSL